MVHGKSGNPHGHGSAAVLNEDLVRLSQNVKEHEQVAGCAADILNLNDPYRPEPAGRKQQGQEQKHNAPHQQRSNGNDEILFFGKAIIAACVGVLERNAELRLLMAEKPHQSAVNGLVADDVHKDAHSHNKQPDGRKIPFTMEQKACCNSQERQYHMINLKTEDINDR